MITAIMRIETCTPEPPYPVHCPTMIEQGLIGKAFRCFSCLQRKSHRKLGAIMSGKPICRVCQPYLDEADVEAMVIFDRWRGFN